MTQLKDPAADIIKNLKPEVTEKDKTDNLKVMEDAKTERLKVWKRPASKQGRDEARAERQADWEARR